MSQFTKTKPLTMNVLKTKRVQTSQLSYNLCAKMWGHLKSALQKGKKNKAWMRFLIVGFIKQHPMLTWDPRMMNLFASHLRHIEPERFSEKVETLVKSFGGVPIEEIKLFVIRCREFERHMMSRRRFNSEGSFVFGEGNMIRILGDEIETKYVVVTEAAAA